METMKFKFEVVRLVLNVNINRTYNVQEVNILEHLQYVQVYNSV